MRRTLLACLVVGLMTSWAIAADPAPFAEPLQVGVEARKITGDYYKAQSEAKTAEERAKALATRNETIEKLLKAAADAKSAEHSELARLNFLLNHYDAAASAADAGFRATGLNATDVAITHLQDVLDFQVLNRAGFGSQGQNGVLGLGVQDQTGGVSLRVAADDKDLLTHFGQSGQGVLGSGGLADTTFAVKRNLTKCSHFRIS